MGRYIGRIREDCVPFPRHVRLQAGGQDGGIRRLADIAKARASEEEPDPEELESVSGGETAVQCEKHYACYLIYRHGDKEDKSEVMKHPIT